MSEYILIIKNNITIFNVVIPLIVFTLGILPLFVDREHPYSSPKWIEFVAFLTVLATVLLISLNVYAKSPLFSVNDCITIKYKYHNLTDFPKLNKIYNSPSKILDIKNGYYLVKQQNQIHQIKTSHDYKYEFCD